MAYSSGANKRQWTRIWKKRSLEKQSKMLFQQLKMLHCTAIVIMVVSTMVTCAEVTSNSGGLSRYKLTRELIKARKRLQDLQSLENRLKDNVWLDDTWIEAFRVETGSGQAAYTSFTNQATGNGPSERVCRPENYRNNRLLDTWASGMIDVVRVSIRQGGSEQAYVEFNARNSSLESWFSKDRVLNSSWTDLKSQTAINFSVTGLVYLAEIRRRFYIFHKHGGCPKDIGWFAVLDQPDGCGGTWNYNPDIETPIILYSKLNHRVGFTSKDLGVADEMVIAVKLRDVITCSDSCQP